jgi:acyl-CoA thioesterase-1
MLRGVDPAVAERNLDAMLAEFARRDIPVVLAGMLAAPNLDPRYRAQFDGLYPRLAAKHDATLYPFFLQGVIGNRALILSDGVHPNFEGIKRVVTGILPTVQRALSPRR